MKTIDQYLQYFEKIKSKNDDFKKIAMGVKSFFKDCDFYQFDWEDLKKLGFAKWNEEDNRLIIPGYFAECITQGTKLENLNQEIVYYDINILDLSEYDNNFLPYTLIKEELNRVHNIEL